MMLDAAKAWYAAGCSVVRVSVDGSKAPMGSWKAFQSTRASLSDLQTWYSDGHPGIGIVTGAISGNLEMLEFEKSAVVDNIQLKMRADLEAAGIGELWRRIVKGYIEESPSGGLHLLYRVEGGVSGNTKLAQRPTGLEGPGVSKASPLIETRGEAGQVVVAPSHGAVHPSGKPWKVLAGSPAEIATITAEERDLLHAVARSFDEMPAATPIPANLKSEASRLKDNASDLTPGEDFCIRGDWRELLEPHGWTVTYVRGDSTFWTRPGKSTRLGASAVTGGDIGDYMYVFTTSSELPSEEAMSKWRVFAYLNYAGDFSAAAAALRREGYGTDRALPERSYSGDGFDGIFDKVTFADSQVSPEGREAESGNVAPTLEDLREADIERRAEEELRKLEARDRAKRRHAAKQTAGFNLDEVLLDAVDIDAVEELAYLVDGLLPESATTFLVGESGAGKSFVAIAIGLAVATGHRALNRHANHGKVLYIAGEGLKGLRGRIRTWLDYEDRLLKPGAFTVVQATPQLVDDRAIEQLRLYVEQHQISLVVLDTLARANIGTDENSTQDQGIAMAALDHIRSGNDSCTIMAVHHAGKDGQYRGSTAIKAAADTMISLTREKPGAPIAVRIAKQKDGEEGPVGQFILWDPPSAPSAVLRTFDGYGTEAY